MVFTNVIVAQFQEFLTELYKKIKGQSVVNVRMYNDGMRFMVDNGYHDFNVRQDGGCSTTYPLHVGQIHKAIEVLNHLTGTVDVRIDVYRIEMTISF